MRRNETRRDPSPPLPHRRAVALAFLFALHMAAAGSAPVTVRCAGLDAVILTPLGIVLAPADGPPKVVETCEETDEP